MLTCKTPQHLRSIRLALIAGLASVIGQCGTPAASTAPGPTSFEGPKAFIDITDRLGDAAHSNGWGGLAVFDYDNDGDLDLYITNGPGFPNRLLRNDGEGHFTDVTDEAGVALTADNCVACAVGDFNNDGWLDLLVGRQKQDVPAGAPVGAVMLLNNGPDASGVVTFRVATPQETGFDSQVPSMGFGVGDLDNDGLLDIVVGRYDMTVSVFVHVVSVYDSQPNEVWRCTGVVGGVPHYQRVPNAADGVFQHGTTTDTQNQMFIPVTFVTHLTDIDNDGKLDILYLHDIPGGIDYYHNDGNFTFSLRQTDMLNQHGGWMGIASGDYDSDGDLDYFVANTGCDFYQAALDGAITNVQADPTGTFFHKLLRNDGGVLTDVAASTPVIASSALAPDNNFKGSGLQATEFGFGASWIDADNRGALDLYWVGDLIAYLQRGLALNAHGIGRFLENNGDGSFTDRTAERGLFDIQPDRLLKFGEQDAGRAVVAADLNGDGFSDLVVTNSSYYGGPSPLHRVFLNRGVPDNHWLTVRLAGTVSNRFGVGARLLATVGGRSTAAEVMTSTSSFCGMQPQAHFGLGSQTTVDQLTVRWPSGRTSVLTAIPADQVLLVTEP